MSFVRWNYFIHVGLTEGKKGIMGLAFVEEDGQVVLTSCAAVKLRSVQANSSIELVLNAGVQEYHKRYRAGTTTLIAMTHHWVRELQNLNSAGVPYAAIVKYFKLGIEKTVRCLELIAIPVEELIKTGKSEDNNDINTCNTSQSSSENEINLENVIKINISTPTEDHPSEAESFSGAADADHYQWYFEDNPLMKDELQLLSIFSQNLHQNENSIQESNFKCSNKETSKEKSGSDVYSSLKSGHLVGQSDDEFDACFDDVKNDEPNKDTESHEADTGTESQGLKTRCDPSTGTVEKGKRTLSAQDIQNKLQAILNKKVSIGLKQVFTGSRHMNNVVGEDGAPETLKGMPAEGSDKIDESFPVALDDTRLCLTGESDNGSVNLSVYQKLIGGLVHDCDELVQPLVQVLKEQNKMSKTSRHDSVRFNVHQLCTLSLQGTLGDSTEVVCGIITSVDLDQMTLLQKRNTSPFRCLLLNGDLKESFVHKGYKQNQNVKYERSSLTDKSSRQSVWLDQVCVVLEKLQVDVILTTGQTDQSFIDYCNSKGVIVLTNVSNKGLQALAYSFGTSIGTYIAEACCDNIVDSLTIKPLNKSWMDRLRISKESQSVLLVISQPVLQTVVFIHPVFAMAEVKEELFWHAAYRLNHTLTVGKVLKGNSESFCADRLKKWAQELEESGSNVSTQAYQSAVYIAMAQAFHQFTIERFQSRGLVVSSSAESMDGDISLCSGHCDLDKLYSSGYIQFDDFVSKTEAWMSAGHLALQVFCSDTEIITGDTSEGLFEMITL